MYLFHQLLTTDYFHPNTHSSYFNFLGLTREILKDTIQTIGKNQTQTEHASGVPMSGRRGGARELHDL